MECFAQTKLHRTLGKLLMVDNSILFIVLPPVLNVGQSVCEWLIGIQWTVNNDGRTPIAWLMMCYCISNAHDSMILPSIICWNVRHSFNCLTCTDPVWALLRFHVTRLLVYHIRSTRHGTYVAVQITCKLVINCMFMTGPFPETHWLCRNQTRLRWRRDTLLVFTCSLLYFCSRILERKLLLLAS